MGHESAPFLSLSGQAPDIAHQTLKRRPVPALRLHHLELEAAAVPRSP